MGKREPGKGFDSLISTTTGAFAASSAETEAVVNADIPKMINNRQSVYRVPLAMIKPDRFQARYILPYEIRKDFYMGKIDWETATRRWLELGNRDRLIRREIDELVFLGESLQDEGQIKPVTGQVISEGGRDIFLMLTGERRFWATAIKHILDGSREQPFVLAIIDNQPSLSKQIAENMAYKALTAVGKARAAARIVLEANGLKPQPGEDEYAYFRQIGEMRLSDETRDSLQDTLQLERTYYGRLMKFFELPEGLLEVCDRSEMPERVLREIMQYDPKFWQPGVLFYAEQDGRTYLEVHAFLERLVGREPSRSPRLPADPVTKSARALRRAIYSVEDIPQDDKIGTLADALLGDVTHEQAQKLYGVISDLKDALAIRVKNL